MPTQDEIMQQIVDLVTEGAGGALPAGAEDALRDRYFKWIGEVKKDNTTSPQDVWDEDDGKRIRERIKYIGESFTEKLKENTNLGKEDFNDVCRQVEAASACPHCPDPPGS